MTTIGIDQISAAAAAIAPHILTTPALPNRWLSQLSDARVTVKWESLQLTGSFKLRGALNKMMALKTRGIESVLGVSAGNHGLGLAQAASLLGMRATIVVPATAATTKVAALRDYGVELILIGENYDEAELAALKLARERGVEFVSPYNDAEIIAGQGTVALELLPENSFDLLLAPVGGGGLLAGLAIVAAAISQCPVIGVQPANSTAMQSSFRAGQLVNVSETPTCADGLAGNIEADSITFPIIRSLVTDIVTVSESAIEQTIVKFLSHDHMMVEGSGAVAAAALLEKKIPSHYKNIGLIVSGRNIDPLRLRALIEKYPDALH